MQATETEGIMRTVFLLLNLIQFMFGRRLPNVKTYKVPVAIARQQAHVQYGTKALILLDRDTDYQHLKRDQWELALIDVCRGLPHWRKDYPDCDDMVRIILGRLTDNYCNGAAYGKVRQPDGDVHAVVVLWYGGSWHIFEHLDGKLDPAGYELLRIVS